MSLQRTLKASFHLLLLQKENSIKTGQTKELESKPWFKKKSLITTYHRTPCGGSSS